MPHGTYCRTTRAPMGCNAPDEALLAAERKWLNYQMAQAEARGSSRVRVDASSMRALFREQLATRPWLANRLNRAEMNSRGTIMINIRSLRSLLNEQLAGSEQPIAPGPVLPNNTETAA